MHISLTFNNIQYRTDLSEGLDISIPMDPASPGPRCFYAPPFQADPVRSGSFIGSIEAGSPVNFKNLLINPHGNGTHTECAGHITDGPFFINDCLKNSHSIARLITVMPVKMDNGDDVIDATLLEKQLDGYQETETIIIRSLPNDASKRTRDYSGANPPYFTKEAIRFLNLRSVKHLITDLPSVDRESDGGRLEAHKEFWGFPDFPDKYKTITELVYIDNVIPDGLYLCNIQIAPLATDASPGRVVLFALKKSD
jgi:kynurenine formamidase